MVDRAQLDAKSQLQLTFHSVHCQSLRPKGMKERGSLQGDTHLQCLHLLCIPWLSPVSSLLNCCTVISKDVWQCFLTIYATFQKGWWNCVCKSRLMLSYSGIFFQLAAVTRRGKGNKMGEGEQNPLNRTRGSFTAAFHSLLCSRSQHRATKQRSRRKGKGRESTK